MEATKRRVLNIPHDIVEEILVKVPVESMVRFKAVSKEWRGTIESKCFIEKHIRYQRSLGGGQARILYMSGRNRSLLLENLLIMSTNGIVPIAPYRPIKPFRRTYDFKVSEPCDGLFCIYTSRREFKLVNPATNSRRILPDPGEAGGHTSYSLLGIGRENVVSPMYKLVWFFDGDAKLLNKSTRCKVFALDSNTWRYVDPPNYRINYGQPLIHLDGVLYCFSLDIEKLEGTYTVLCIRVLAFDLHSETFQSLSLTPDIGSIWYRELGMCVLNHRLCIFKKRVGDNDLLFKIWGLDINMRSWEIMYSIDLSCLPPEFDNKVIIPVATVNNYVILRNHSHTTWVLYGSKTHILRCTYFVSKYILSFHETLVSVYQ